MMIMEDNAALEMRRFFLGHAQVERAGRSPRRCLFGPIDPDSNREFVRAEMEHIYEQQKRKWNFDFELEVPLPGRYQWEPVGNSSPEQSRTELRFGRQGASRAESDPAEGSGSEARDQQQTAGSANPTSEQQPRLRQQQITELLPTRKRPAASKSCDDDDVPAEDHRDSTPPAKRPNTSSHPDDASSV